MTTSKMIFSYQIGDDSSFFHISKDTAVKMAGIILKMEKSEEYCHFEIAPHAGEFKAAHGVYPLPCSIEM